MAHDENRHSQTPAGPLTAGSPHASQTPAGPPPASAPAGAQHHPSAPVPAGAHHHPSAPLSRRQFLVGVGGLGIGAVLGGALVCAALPEEVYAVEASDGYLLVDTKKCAGCESCMLACSLAHSGKENLALSRIQISKNALVGYPADIAQRQCRQCPYPSCVDACPVGAMHVDPETHVRLVSEEKCIGCERCILACPFTPSRVQWNFEDKHAQKCDLCKNTPYWNRTGGPAGDQACICVCPMKAISFTHDIPAQSEAGYDINLRTENWSDLHFPVDDAGVVPPALREPEKFKAKAASDSAAKIA